MFKRKTAAVGEFDLSRRAWLIQTLIGLLIVGVLCWPTWPGYMSYDNMFAYKESLEGITTAVWPPAQAYFYWLSRNLGMEVWGFYLFQTICLTVCSLIVIGFFLKDRRALYMATALFAATLMIFPSLWGTIAVQWKDVATTGLALLGVVCWLMAVRHRSWAWLVGAALAYSISVALRYNAFPLTFFAILLMVAYPFGPASTRNTRLISFFLAFMALLVAYASTTYRLPDFQKLPSNRGFVGIQVFDLVGTSTCAQENIVPSGVSKDVPVSVDQLTRMYDPRHVHITIAPRDDLPQLFETDADGAVSTAWLEAVTGKTSCYLWHRWNVFRVLMGLNDGPLFYPTHGTIDQNPYGIELANEDRSKTFNQYILQMADIFALRPFWLYLLAATTTVLTLGKDMPGRITRSALLAGAYAYPATLFFVAPAGDARYIFPSTIFCLILICINIGLLLQCVLHRDKHQSSDVTVA
jgi:hypothetical protein